ncbi:MFS general substrate transporter [Penicillium subrubescens]|uniref:Major facilitator superfamily (MFS) profile domain-containing protein n=1 Tax=Penicillium subrubescens TaxID=1316194 RepID=A0A1Q5UJ00_9EURO|nr:MFS general substrate transporter [Penicillium subrubescens]KAJ5900220.1 MFS general substrate transporter [Penicillium subrubescens]OKP12450.1 hypothetical protein PENSUB_1910 [Penicillium subrubescens]
MTFIDPPEEELQLTSEEDPRKWPTWKRIWISVGPLLGVFSLTSGNSIYVAAVPLVNAEFQVGSTLGMLPITLYTLGLALGPIISSSTSEVYGRRPVYVLSLLGAMAFNAVGGSASNFRTLAVARLLAGITGGPMIPVVAGTLNDLWDTPSEQIGTRLMGLFACSIAWGSEIGPVMGQPIIEVSGNWRWTFWLSIILLGVSCVVWLNPETFGPELLRQKCRRLGKPPPPRGSLKDNLKIALGRPLHMMIVEPVIVPTSFISAISLSIVFFFYVAYPFIFESIYSFTPHQVALSFLSLLIGSALGLVIMIFINKRLHKKAEMLARTRRLTMKPEEHLYHTMLGGILLPLSLFWFVSS